ncbi:AAA family ATPase [Chitinimonas taiwanensis]|uniref:Predicted ATP-binding protein involved in virulence n=1 Tax=Chitinimonas taiwanensis DSM 18899 TaxID=1121279 RepID=A0A1K2HMJ8_9NEIS|nr:AAA family ATPase [Chitinimonas taiwanensis]SFZ77999.1 Predicted ATP-binding protein involved in virulence [Chitinimonas taiwanensis DSM 18899]
MYFRKIEIENAGPIDHLSIDFPMNASGSPKPLVIVGENGTGKTILLSYLVNTLIAAKQAAFDDTEVEHGKVYKYRSPQYIRSGALYSYGRAEFANGQFVEEWQLSVIKSKFEEIFSFSPARRSWTAISPNELSHFESSLARNEPSARELFENKCCLYFPVNRFEEPAWLNVDNLKERAAYTELKHVDRYSNRSIISTSPLKVNRNWLLDLIFDRQAFEMRTQNVALPFGPSQESISVPVFGGFKGQSTRIYEAVLQLLRTTLRVEGKVRLGAGTRHNRLISIIKDEAPWIPNIFQLSTGEVLLLNLFLSTIRDYDLSGGSVDDLSDIRGIVVIDEIDAHLHTSHQKEILPNLLASFPNVQFIITSHSPLFLLGLEERLGCDGFKIVNMPDGEVLSASDFSEFTAAYETFKQTSLYRQDILNALKANSRPIVFVEGDYDIRYITRAAELLAKSHVLDAIQLRDGSGFGNLDKIWRSYEVQLAELLPSKILLLYDCDTGKATSEKGQLIKRIVPSVVESAISIGIENLIPVDIISRLEKSHPQFIDSTDSTTTRIRGCEVVTPAKKSVNKDEKKNLCDWFCANGTPEDFRNFASIFDIIESSLLAP